MKQDATSQALIRQIVANVTCTSCGHHFALNDIEFVGRRENIWAMRVNCRECRTKALLFAVVNHGTARSIYSDLAPEDWDRFKDSASISVDDVIAIHEYMQSYEGDFSEILEEPVPAEE